MLIMTMQVHEPKSILRMAVGILTLFGVFGFAGSVVTVFYTGLIIFELVWVCTGCIIAGFVMLGVLRK